MSRKGFTLIELLVTVVVLMGAMVVSTQVFLLVVRDLPRVSRAVNSNRRLAAMLKMLRADVEAARSAEADGGKLIIERPDGKVVYEYTPGRVVRRRGGKQVDRWDAPGAKVAWRIRRRGGKASAVEVRTRIERVISGRTESKLANSHMFFLPAGARGKK